MVDTGDCASGIDPKDSYPYKKGGIVLLLKNEKGETLAELERERTTIGRDPSNDLVLEDPSVSGFHAVVLNDRGAVSVVDLGSTNGTAMNGKRLRQRTALNPWCRLQLGGVKLVVADTESREPTRVQPVVPAAGPEGRPDATVQPTQVRPGAQAATRVVRPPQPAGGIRFESLQSDAAGTRVSPAHPPSPQVPSPQPTMLQDSGQAAATDSPFALIGGYPRGLGWLLFSFRGRIRRSLFWKCFGIGLAAGLTLHLMTAFLLWEIGNHRYAYQISSFFYGLVTLWPWMAVFGKRYHDLGHRALPWCGLWIFLSMLGLVGNLMQIDRASDGAMFIFGLVTLPVTVVWLYGLYLILVKRGDNRDNQFGDQNPRHGIVFPS